MYCSCGQWLMSNKSNIILPLLNVSSWSNFHWKTPVRLMSCTPIPLCWQGDTTWFPLLFLSKDFFLSVYPHISRPFISEHLMALDYSLYWDPASLTVSCSLSCWDEELKSNRKWIRVCIDACNLTSPHLTWQYFRFINSIAQFKCSSLQLMFCTKVWWGEKIHVWWLHVSFAKWGQFYINCLTSIVREFL